eukprot:Sspe_Gene.60654::Locus_33468_Transcript_2_3_Confidence_0.500_Length_1319::g.60654::m.60654
MGRIKDLIRAKNSEGGGVPMGWDTVQPELLEAGFDLRPTNICGSHPEVLENRTENRRRTLQTIIPEYNALSDPHLTKYHRTNAVIYHSPAAKQAAEIYNVPPKRRPRPHSAGASRTKVRVKGPLVRTKSKVVGYERSKVPPTSFIVSTEQVLQLKRIFWNHSDEPPVGEKRVIDMEKTTNFAFVYLCAVNAVNLHRKLHQRLFLPVAPMDCLWAALCVLEATKRIDWMTFLLLCTIDISHPREFRKLVHLKDLHSQYLQSNPVACEKDFLNLVVHLNGGKAVGEDQAIVSFFQQGDFYKGRGSFDHFPEAVFCLYEFFTQVYILRARARGNQLSYNFKGHSPPGNVGGPGEVARPRSCPSSLKKSPQRLRGNTEWLP